MLNKIIYNNKIDKFYIIDGNNDLLCEEDIITDISKLPSNVLNNPNIYLGVDYELFEFNINKIKQKFFNLKPSSSDISSETLYENSEGYGFCIYEHTRVISIISGNLFKYLPEFGLTFTDFLKRVVFNNFIKSLIRKEYEF